MKFGKRKIALAIMTVSLLVGLVAAVFVPRFLLQKQAAIEITSNSFAIEIYQDAEGLTVADSIDFGSVMHGELAGSLINATTVFLFCKNGVNAKEQIDLKWNTTNLPLGASITCYADFGTVAGEVEWVENFASSGIVIPRLGGDLTGMPVTFAMNANDLQPRNYQFAINIYAGN